MEQKSFPFLRNWNLSSNQSDIIITGSVYGHQNIADSRKINTSPVQKVAFSRESWDRLYFYTHNTVYECPLNQVDPTCQFTKKYLLETMPHEHETWDKWINDDPTRPETPFDSVDLPVCDGSFLLALDADSPHLFHGVYQKFGSKYHWIIRNPYVNMGMYTDSVLCNKYDDQLNLLFDVRYFPQGAQKLRFYDIEFGNPSVLFYVVNVGQSSIYYDGNTLESWHYFQLLEKNKEEIHPEPEPEPPVEELNAFIRPNEPRPPLPSRLQHLDEGDSAEMEENSTENMISTLENREENPDEAIVDHIFSENVADEEIFTQQSEEFDLSNEEESPTEQEEESLDYSGMNLEDESKIQEKQDVETPLQFEIQPEINFRPELPPDSVENQGETEDNNLPGENEIIAQQMAAQIERLQAQTSMMLQKTTEASVENAENLSPDENGEYVEKPDQNEPRKSLLEEALEFEKNSIPPKTKVDWSDEEESREQVLFSSLALYGVALEEIPLEPNESGTELESFDEIPALNLENFPDAEQEDIARLNLADNTEFI